MRTPGVDSEVVQRPGLVAAVAAVLAWTVGSQDYVPLLKGDTRLRVFSALRVGRVTADEPYFWRAYRSECFWVIVRPSAKAVDGPEATVFDDIDRLDDCGSPRWQEICEAPRGLHRPHADVCNPMQVGRPFREQRPRRRPARRPEQARRPQFLTVESGWHDAGMGAGVDSGSQRTEGGSRQSA